MKVSKCIVHAIRIRSKERLTKPRYHWLDYADQKFGKQLVYDIKCLLKILILYIPFPIFWALFDQQSSSWTFQATQMDGYVSSKFTIKPDQIQVLNPLLALVFIPLFNFVVYPVLEKVGIKTPLRKMILGMTLCGVAFVASGFLEMALQKSYAEMPQKGEGQLRVFNGQSCGYRIQTDLENGTNFELPLTSMWSEKHVAVPSKTRSIQYKLIPDGERANCPLELTSGKFKLNEMTANSFFLTSTGVLVPYNDSPQRSDTSLPRIRLLMTSEYALDNVTTEATGIVKTDVVFHSTDASTKMSKFFSDIHKTYEIDPGTYLVWINGTRVGAAEFKQGGAYTIVINRSGPNHYVSSNLSERKHFSDDSTT